MSLYQILWLGLDDVGGAKSERETVKVTHIYPLSELRNCNEQDAERHGWK